MSTTTAPELPGLNCGLCGSRTCDELAARMISRPDLLRRCIPLSQNRIDGNASLQANDAAPCASACSVARPAARDDRSWTDTLGRGFDFYLEHFPEDPGPREIILPHNPMLTRELDIQRGDVLIGRPLGMSCGCPITHCGIAMDVDKRNGVIVWCVTGPLNPRQQGCKDLGYYIAEGYEGIITEARSEPRIGMRYYFQPRMCMLQWRHSGLVNYLNRVPSGWQVRLEGLWIG
jgi:uncharacterized Fe-S cluster-containing protein